jgi:hypothetical protein
MTIQSFAPVRGIIKIADTDLPRLGHDIGCGEDELHAVLDVETSGSGYDKSGRLKMLYEPHKFYGLLKGAALATAVAQGLAYPKQGTQPYPSDSYPRLIKAMQIDEVAALKSCSWGLGQIMGGNHVAAGYDNVEKMVQAFIDSEAAQLEGMVDFIKANHLDDELRTHNWAAFARGYNGPNYKVNAYDTKLAARYAFWQKIRDTPWAPPIEQTLSVALRKTPEQAVVMQPVAVEAPKPPVLTVDKVVPVINPPKTPIAVRFSIFDKIADAISRSTGA